MKDDDKPREELIEELGELRRELAAYRARAARADRDELAVTVSLLEATLESTADGILVVDAQGRQVAVNDNFRRMWGFHESEIVSLDHREALVFVLGQLKDLDGFLGKVKDLYAQPEAESFDTLELKDGRVFERYSRPRRVGGAPQGRVWSFRDVTDRVRIERELRRSKQRLDLIMDTVPAFISYIDADLRYQVVNEEYERAFGIRRQDIVGKRIVEIIGQEIFEKIKPQVDRVLAGEKQWYEVTMELKNLGLRSLRIENVPEMDADGRVKGYFLLGTDITEKKQAQEVLEGYRLRLEEKVRQRTAQLESARDEAQRANRAKRDFLARMSHEIRTPLNGVIGLARLMMKCDLPPREREYVEKLASSADTLHHLVDKILDFSKIEAGKLELVEAGFHVGDVLLDTVRVLAPLAAEKGLALEVSSGRELEWYSGDRARIRQVLLNLVGNAIKFTEKGRVEVSAVEQAAVEQAAVEQAAVEQVHADGRTVVRFTVSDTGVGVPADSLARIFDRFERVERSGSQGLEGTGLGLAICKRLVELMGGEIGVESTTGEGLPDDAETGSTFWFTLPLGRAQAPADAAQAERGAEAPARPDDFRVLVAEDNPVNQLVTRRVLEDLGYGADVVANGREALEALAAGGYALVLMDCRMPELDGYEATRRIREGELGGVGLPIVALTANASREDLDLCLETGMNDYLSKPFSEEDLQNVLARWINPTSGPLRTP